MEHRPSTTHRHRTLFWAALVIPDQLVPLLFQLCFSVSPPAVARPASLPLPLRVPGQGLACGARCWLLEGVSDPASLPPQYLLGHWFLSCSLPQIFISDLLLPLDFADAPQTGVETCLDLSLKLDFTLTKTTGHCSTVHGKFLSVLDFLVTTTSTDTLASTGTLNL